MGQRLSATIDLLNRPVLLPLQYLMACVTHDVLTPNRRSFQFADCSPAVGAALRRIVREHGSHQSGPHALAHVHRLPLSSAELVRFQCVPCLPLLPFGSAPPIQEQTDNESQHEDKSADPICGQLNIRNIGEHGFPLSAAMRLRGKR